MKHEDFLNLGNLLPDAMLLISDGKVVSANRAARKLIGEVVAPSVLIGAPLNKLVTDSEEKLGRFLAVCAGSKEPVVGSLSFGLENGPTAIFQCKGALLNRATETTAADIFLHCLPKKQGGSRFTLLNRKIEELNREIRKQKQADEALRRYQEMLDGIINNATAVIYIKDLQGHYTLVNRHFEELFEIEFAELKNKTDFDIFPSEVAGLMQKNDQLVSQSAQPIHIEEVIPHTDGPHTYLSNKFPLFDADKKVYAVCGILTDITRLKQAEEKILRFNQELEQRIQERTRDLKASNRELESYSYSIAHDLRTPLRAIVSFSQILQEDTAEKLNEEESAILSRIINAGKYMSKLIDDILELGRISRTEMEMTPIDLSKLVRASIERLCDHGRMQKMRFVIEDGLGISGDVRLVAVLLDNLLGNACKYSSRNPQPVIEFGQCQMQGETVYFVRDNGVGFDMQYADKLFDPFQRMYSAEEFEGTGIGLATAQRIVHRHGGRIWAESTPGEGTSFYFVLSEK